ncbi:MAG: ATP-binding protein [Anaerolineae bacterium]|nr:ATP-binding protein [Anaerolineae bacterium]
MNLPTLVVITGAPCTGKSSIARSLAERLSLPLIEKDAIKEQLFDSLGAGDRDWSTRLSRASFDLLYTFAELALRAGPGCIVEGNFKPVEETQHFKTLIKSTGCEVVQVYCHSSAKVVWARHSRRAIQRHRHPGHVDHLYRPNEVARKAVDGTYTPLDIGGRLIEIDTGGAGAIDIDALVEWIREDGRKKD